MLRQTAGRLFNLGLGVVVTVLVVRLLGDERFGQWVTLLSLLTIVNYLSDFGLQQVTVRRAAAEPDDEAIWVGALLRLRAGLSAVVCLGFVGVLVALAEDREMLVAGLILAAGIVIGVPTVIGVVFQLRVRNDINVAVMTVNSVVWTGAVAVLYVTSGGLIAVAASFLAAAVVSTVLQVGLALRRVRPRLRGVGDHVRRLVRVGLPIGIGGLLITAYAKVDAVMVFELAGARQAGLYGVVYRLLEQAAFVPIVLSATMLPLMSAAHRADPVRLRRLVQSSLDVMALAALPGLAFALVAAEPVIVLVFGEEFRAASPALPILMGAYGLICLGYVAGLLVVVLERQRTFLLLALAGLVVNVALNFLLIPSYGFLAAAWVTLVTELLVGSLTLAVVLREMRFLPGPGRIARAGAAAVAMGACVGLARAAGAPAVVLLLVGAAVYPLAALATGATSVGELRRLRSAPS